MGIQHPQERSVCGELSWIGAKTRHKDVPIFAEGKLCRKPSFTGFNDPVVSI